MQRASTYLVTGALGLLGSRLVERVRALGHVPVGVARPGSAPPPANARLEFCDLADASAVDALFRRERPDVVLHSAALAHVDTCQREGARAFRDNVVAAGNVAAAAQHSGAHVVYVSTDYVFDGTSGPHGEDDAPAPYGVYPTTKWLGEQATRLLAPSWAIARTAIVFGVHSSRPTGFGQWVVGCLARGERVRLFADQTVSPTYVNNAAAMIAEIGERRLPGIWNTAGADVVTRVEFGEAVCRVFGFSRDLIEAVPMGDVDLALPRPKKSGLLTDKARRQLANRPLPLDDALAFFRDEWRAEHGQ